MREEDRAVEEAPDAGPADLRAPDAGSPDLASDACTPRTCAELAGACGVVDDGCGGVVLCGPCADGGSSDFGSDGGGQSPDAATQGEPDASPADGPQADACVSPGCGAACGIVADGCGGFVFCGACPDAAIADAPIADAATDAGSAADACVPIRCADEPRCGVVPDGCGGWRLCLCPDASASDVLDGSAWDAGDGTTADVSSDPPAPEAAGPDAGADGAVPDAAFFDDAATPDACVPRSCGAELCGAVPDGCGAVLQCPPCPCLLGRGDEPVILTGADVPALYGLPPGSVRAYRWGADGFVEVPSQVDERVRRAWSPLASELSYVFDHWGFGMEVEDDSLVDAIDEDDEVALLASGTGDPAPPDEWVAGADARRIEVTLTDPRNGCAARVYLFTFAAPPATTLPNIEYSKTGIQTTITTSGYRAHYANDWALDEISVAGCSGWCTDLIDRYKGRAFAIVGGETEDTWAATSDYVGALTGAVRAIREVKGAASGQHTTYIAEFYAGRILVTDYLRVHPMPAVYRYFDYNQDIDNLRYTDDVLPDHRDVDGVPDAIGVELRRHFQVSSYAADLGAAQGSLVHMIEMLDMSAMPGGLDDVLTYHEDDSSLDDGTGDVPRVAWGNAGAAALAICAPGPTEAECVVDPDQPCCPVPAGSESHPVIGRVTTVVLPPAVEQPPISAEYWDRLAGYPLGVAIVDQLQP